MDNRKRAHSVHSSSEDSDPEPKRPKLVKTPKKGQKVQKPVSGFLSVSAVQSSADKASPATFNVDTVVEVYRFLPLQETHYCVFIAVRQVIERLQKVLPPILRIGRGCQTGQHWVI